MTTPGYQFAPPSGGGDYFAPKDFIGHPILIKAVHEVDKHFDQLKNNRQGGEVDRVRFDYVDLSDPAGPNAELVEDALNTHIGIVSRLKRYVGTGQMVLGRVGTVPAKQVGMSPAFVLDDISTEPDVIAAATAWLNAWQAKQFAAPAAPPAAQGNGGPVAPVAPVGPTGPIQTPFANTPHGMALAQAQQSAAPAAPPVTLPPGMTAEQVAALQAGGFDMAAISQLATNLGATAVPPGQ